MSQEIGVKFLSSTVGRDRMNRFIQYFCRFLIGYGSWTPETLGKLNTLMQHAANTRKFMRIGRQLEFYATAQKAVTVKDDVLKNTTILKNAGLALWLVHDSLAYFHSMGLITLENVKQITKRGLQFWLFALVASLINGLHRLRQNGIKIIQERKALTFANQKKLASDAEQAEKTIHSLEMYF